MCYFLIGGLKAKKLCRTIREIVFDIKRYPRDYLRAAIGFVVVFVCTAYLQNKFGTGQSILSENFGECFIPVFFGAIFFVFCLPTKNLEHRYAQILWILTGCLLFVGWILYSIQSNAIDTYANIAVMIFTAYFSSVKNSLDNRKKRESEELSTTYDKEILNALVGIERQLVELNRKK